MSFEMLSRNSHINEKVPVSRHPVLRGLARTFYPFNLYYSTRTSLQEYINIYINVTMFFVYPEITWWRLHISCRLFRLALYRQQYLSFIVV